MVPEVDPDDDSRSRWVLYRYRYDPDRRQRRNVVVAAYDAEAEMWAAMERARSQLDDELRAGTAEAQERLFADHLPAGHRERQREARLRPRRRLAARREDLGRAADDGDTEASPS